MQHSRIVFILELRHKSDLDLPKLKEKLIRLVRDETVQHSTGMLSIGVTYENQEE